MKLIYRGETIEYTPSLTPTYHKPHALNWRYQTRGETYGNSSLPAMPYEEPLALNWRYRTH